MADHVRSFFYVSVYWRMASIAAISICILSSIPQHGICLAADHFESNQFAGEILDRVGDRNQNLLINQFDQLEETFKSSPDPLDAGRKFLQSFINEINFRYGLNLTIQ